jgi:hypothetical protein
MSKHDDALMRRITDTLEQQARDDEQRHGLRLDRARREALAARRSRDRRWPLAWPVAATAGLAAMVVTLNVLQPGPGPDAVEPPPQTPDLDLLTSAEFELALQDVAFYEWVAEQRDPDDREVSG